MPEIDSRSTYRALLKTTQRPSIVASLTQVRLLYLLLPTSTSAYFYLLPPTYFYLPYLLLPVARSSDKTRLFAQESPEKSVKVVKG